MSQDEQVVSIRLRRNTTSTPWGFRMQGGVEYGGPLFIQSVNPKSLASRQGLRVGDRMLAIGSAQAHKMAHEQAKMEIIRSGNELDIVVQRRANQPGADQPDTTRQMTNHTKNEAYEEPTEYRGYTNPNVQSRSFKILQESLSYSEANEEGMVLPTGNTPGESIVRKAYNEGKSRLEELSEINPRNFQKGDHAPVQKVSEKPLSKAEEEERLQIAMRNREINVASAKMFSGPERKLAPAVDIAASSVLSPVASQQQYLQQAQEHYQKPAEPAKRQRKRPQPQTAVSHNGQPATVTHQGLGNVNYKFDEQVAQGHIIQPNKQKAVVSPQKSNDFIPKTQTVSSVAADLDLKHADQIEDEALKAKDEAKQPSPQKSVGNDAPDGAVITKVQSKSPEKAVKQEAKTPEVKPEAKAPEVKEAKAPEVKKEETKTVEQVSIAVAQPEFAVVAQAETKKMTMPPPKTVKLPETKTVSAPAVTETKPEPAVEVKVEPEPVKAEAEPVAEAEHKVETKERKVEIPSDKIPFDEQKPPVDTTASVVEATVSASVDTMDSSTPAVSQTVTESSPAVEEAAPVVEEAVVSVEKSKPAQPEVVVVASPPAPTENTAPAQEAVSVSIQEPPKAVTVETPTVSVAAEDNVATFSITADADVSTTDSTTVSVPATVDVTSDAAVTIDFQANVDTSANESKTVTLNDTAVVAIKEASPATSTPAAGTPAAGSPAPGTPAAGTPAAGSPAPGTPAAGTPAAGSPAPGTPAAGTPAAGTPAASTPAAGSPAPGTPAAGTPAAGTPAGTPAAGSPAPGTPAAGSPAPGTPATTDSSRSPSPQKKVIDPKGDKPARAKFVDSQGGVAARLAKFKK